MGTNEYHFQKYNDFLDVTVDSDGYLVLKTNTTNEFSIESHAELDKIYAKLKELMNEALKRKRILNKQLKKKK